MPIDYEHLMSLRTRGERIHYTDRDTLLYALGVGFGRNPGNPDELAYVAEHAGLKTLPSYASILASNTLLDDCGWDASRVVLRDESVVLDRPIEEAGTLLVDREVATVSDQGADEGALIVVESRARREQDGQAVFTARRTWLACGDGGFGGPRGSSSSRHVLPTRRPDMTHPCETRADQALLFRLSVDRHPLHVDAAVARQHGLEGPILHGLCLQGIACHAILQVICDFDHTLIRSLAVSFAGPAYPGERLEAELWQDANIVSCRLRALERDAVVLDRGRCVLAT
ncbi:MAG: MaoC/PaaZ C-terminal domain-containing protein [Gammaproteobacteria bacterium]|nr:MaoC/PaaZ C-terminal domain-containing protein [Gammaproteobacteria bacterium]